MADYYINSDKGKELANSLRAGDMAEASDGSLWKKEADGSITVTKNGKSMTGRVGVSAPTLSETPATNFTPAIETPVLNEETRNAAPSVTGSNLDAAQDAKQVRNAVLASEKAKQATGAVTSGLTQDTGNDELLNQAIQQALQPDNYTIGSAKGVLIADKMQKAGDLAEAADGSLWKRNEDGSITVTKDGKTYTATVDRESGKRDPQWAALTAPSVSAENSSAKKGKGGSGSGGGSGTYSTTVSAASAQQSSAQAAGSGTDRATLRKQAATAQKEMGDLARQISVVKIRGKDTSALQKQYNEAKARYDAANTQIESTQQTAEKKNAWQSLPTVQDAERFSAIENVTTGRVRDTEQEVVNAVREETQKHAWKSLPTVQDTDRFGNLPDGLSLIQQATAQQGKTLTGKPYIPTNDSGFTHSSGSTKRQNILERIGNATLGGLLQSGGASMDAAGTMYQAGQGGRDTTYGESRAWFQNQLDSELRTLNSMLLENRQNPGTYTSAEIKNQRRIIAEAQARVNAFALTQGAQQQSGELARDLAADVSNYGAGRVETAKAGASKLGGMALDALASTVQSGADMAANVALGTSGSMIPFAFRAFGGGTQQARNDGADLAQQLTYGGAMAAKEVFTEKMFNIAGLQSKAYGKGSFDDYVEKAVAGAVDKLASTDTGKRLLGGAAQFMTSAAGEGLEELIGDWMEWQLPRIYGKEPDSAKEVAANSLYDFLVGAISGTMGNLTTLGQFTNYDVNEHLGRSQNTQDILLDQAVQNASRGEALAVPTQPAGQTTQQMAHGAAENGAGDVITNVEVNRNSATPEQTTDQSSPSNDMGAMRSQFESVPKQSQTQSNTIGSMEADWNVPESQRTPILYDTISEAKSLDNARLRLAQDYAGEMAELRGKHNWSGEEVDMGMTILDNYRRAAEQTGDWTEYSNWRKEVSAHGTAAGQALQAYAKYSRQTGGGIVADASAALERAAKKTNKAEIMNRVNALAQKYDAAVGTGQENAKVNVNDLVDIIKSASTARQTGTLIGNKTPAIVNWAMNRIANYAKAEAQSGSGENLDFLKTFAADSIYNIAADTRAVSATEKVKTVRRMGMLSKVSTVMRNLVSNNVFDPIDSVARNISVPLDMLVSTITGTRSVAGDASWASAAKRKGSMDGLARACMEVGLDVDTSGGAGKYENTANRTFKMSGGVFSKLMSVWEAYEGYTLNATDEFQKGGIEASVQQSIDRLYEKGKIKDDSLRNAGEQEALYRTFQDKSVLSDAAIGVRNALNKAHIGDIGAGDIMLPFAQVQSNLGARAIEYSPAGLLVSAADFINMLDSAKKGNLTAAQQAKAVQGVGRALTGSGMIAIAAAGALRGWLKVTGDDDDKNKDALGKTHGLDGTQLNISAALRDLREESVEWQAGDQLLSIGFLDPLNAQLTTGALIADDIRSEAGVTAGRVLGNSLSGALQSVLDTPVMSTFQDVANNYEYSTASTPGGKVLDAAQKYAANQLSSVIPNSLRGISQGLDDTERNAYSSDNVWQQAIDNAKASIPGLRETLPAKTDVWGNPVKNEGGIRNFMNRNINPGNVTTYKPDVVSSEIEKISEATNTSLYPDRTAPRSLKVDGEAISLTFEQRSMYQKAYGDAYSAAVTSLMNDKNYKAMPGSMKAEILQQAKDTAKEQARDSLGIGYEMDSAAQKILEKSGAERNNALISAAVKAQHYLSPETQKQLSDVDRQFGGADYVGLSDELFNSAKEKANTYFSAVEAAKYGGELNETQKELADKDSKELARYFMDKAIESRYTDTNKSGTKADEYLKAYRHGELNDAMALAVLSDKEVMAYDRFGRGAKVTPEMALQAANAHAGMKDVKDEDGKVTSSAQDQFDAWLDKQSWTDDQKSAVRMGFYSDSVKTYSYLAEQLRKGNIKTADAKSELTPSYQAGWSKNVRDTGAKMADYIDAIVEYEGRPSEEERKAAGYKNTWTWFCDYLNTTDLTQEQKFGIAISMSDYADNTKKKIWDRLR